MDVYHTNDCGKNRDYNWRYIRHPKIRFSVKAERDAAICLTQRGSSDTEDKYEIFIGCWGGGESGIRRGGKKNDIIHVETPGILSGYEFRSFWIMHSKGILKVGKKGKARPFMSFEDPEKIDGLKYYGYSTGWGAEGDWIFDDDDDNLLTSSSNASSSDSEAEELKQLEHKPIMYKRPARWVLASDGYMPANPVSGGNGADGEVFVGMAKHEGGYILGMVFPAESMCYIPYGGNSIPKEDYYILCNPGGVTLSWVPGSAGVIPSGALEGGITEDGETLFIGRVNVDNIVSCGKVHPSHGVCYVPYGGAEHSHRDYEVLCVSGLPCRFRI